jgi:hypothetical protein
MTRHERIELDKALLEAAIYIASCKVTEIEDIHTALQSKIPARFLSEWEPSDEEARYVALESWVAGQEYTDTIKHRNIWSEGWHSAREHFQGKDELKPFQPDWHAINYPELQPKPVQPRSLPQD